MKPVPRSVNLALAGLFKHPLRPDVTIDPQFQRRLLAASGFAELSLFRSTPPSSPPFLQLKLVFVVKGVTGGKVRQTLVRNSYAASRNDGPSKSSSNRP